MGVVFTCSIDDGYPSDMKMAELLNKNNLKGTFFIPIKNREGLDVLTRQQILDIGRQFEIGSHTYDHCYLKNIDIKEARYQITVGKEKLEDLLGKEVVGFCYPGGQYRQEHIEIVKSAGFRYARTTMNLCFDAGENVFEIPTTCQFYPHNRTVYLRNFVKTGSFGRRQDGLRLALIKSNWIDRLYALFEYACQHDGTFHLWGHSWEIDILDAWRELDDFLAYVAARVAIKNRLNNEQLAARFFQYPIATTAELAIWN